MGFSNRNLFIKGIELTKHSKVPVLFFSNPGYGKTTVVEAWAQQNGYHVETVIGSAFDRTDCNGFQIYNQNANADHLMLAKPYWFHNIEKNDKEGIPSVLFIDEISTTPPDVQGSLFRLIFSRCLQDGTKLPESTLILAAANYKENLPSYFDLCSPTLNRFCLINIDFNSLEDLADEFLNDEEDLTANWPSFKISELSTDKKAELKTKLREFFKKVTDNYFESSDFSKGFLNINNKMLSDIYSTSLVKTGEVLNFISGRTIGYLYKMCCSVLSIGLDMNDSIIDKVIDGLIGIGTNNFKSSEELLMYRNYVKSDIKNIMADVIGMNSLKNGDPEDIFKDCVTISDKVSALSFKMENFVTSSKEISNYFMAVYKQIVEEFPLDEDKFISKIEGIASGDDAKNKIAVFKSDLDAISVLTNELFKNTNFEKVMQPFKSFLLKILKKYDFYKSYSS